MNEDELADRLETGGYRLGAEAAPRRPGDELAALLADAATWAEPEPGGADALLAAIRAERGEDADLWPVRADDPTPLDAYRGPRSLDGTPRRVALGGNGVSAAAAQGPSHGAAAHAAPTRRTRWQWPAAAAAAALVLVVGVAALLIAPGGDDSHPPGEAFSIAGTPMVPGASAVATVDAQPAGVAIVLDVHGLPPADPGTYYQAWVEGAAGRVTVGTFHMRGGDGWIYLWSGVDADRYPMLRVTLEHEGDGDGASDDVVLSGAIDS
ncbi:MAG TPA: anti-sigma factor [Acidimicrobiales bacterium]